MYQRDLQLEYFSMGHKTRQFSVLSDAPQKSDGQHNRQPEFRQLQIAVPMFIADAFPEADGAIVDGGGDEVVVWRVGKDVVFGGDVCQLSCALGLNHGDAVGRSFLIGIAEYSL